MERLEQVMKIIGVEPKALSQELYRDLGKKTPRSVEQYFARRSMPNHSLAVIADYLGVDIAYLMLFTDEMERSTRPGGMLGVILRQRAGQSQDQA